MLTLYTTHCPLCSVLEKKLKAKNIDFVMVDDTSKILELGFNSVPVLQIDDKFLTFTDANNYINSL